MKTQYIVDEKGRKISVVLGIEDYERLMDELDDKYCTKLYDEALEVNEPFIPIEDYLKDRNKHSDNE